MYSTHTYNVGDFTKYASNLESLFKFFKVTSTWQSLQLQQYTLHCELMKTFIHQNRWRFATLTVCPFWWAVRVGLAITNYPLFQVVSQALMICIKRIALCHSKHLNCIERVQCIYMYAHRMLFALPAIVCTLFLQHFMHMYVILFLL